MKNYYYVDYCTGRWESSEFNTYVIATCEEQVVQAIKESCEKERIPWNRKYLFISQVPFDEIVWDISNMPYDGANNNE